jgi:hypothetical protein
MASILNVCVVLALLALAAWPALAARQPQGKDAKPNPYEPRAIQLLQEMTEAYSHLSALKQETEFTSAMMPLVPLPVQAAPEENTGQDEGGTDKPKARDLLNTEHTLDRKIRLSFAAPNRLRLEVEDSDDSGKLQVSRWVSDGKSFWTFNPNKNLFSREKAPAKIHDFSKLAHMTSGSLEVLMLMGVNPFEHVEQQAEAVRCVGKETALGTETEVVAMTADLGLQATETRLYIGVADHLLHRLVSETSQKALAPKQQSGVGSPLDELAPSDSGPPPIVNPGDVPSLPGILMKSRITCDNKIDTEPRFDFTVFAYQPPADAFYLTNPDPHKPPMTMKQRIAELNRAAKRQHKAAPKVIRL